MRKQHFAKVCINFLAFIIFNGDFDVFQAQTHQFMAPVFRCFQRHQRRIQLCHMMTSRLCKTIAITRRTCPGIGKTTGTNDHTIGFFFFAVFQSDTCCFAILNENAVHRAFQMQLHLIFLDVFFQGKNHIQRTIRNREYPFAAFHLQFQTKVSEKFLQTETVQLIKRTVHEIRIAGNIIQQAFHITVIGHIAAAFACDEDFLTNSIIFFV